MKISIIIPAYNAAGYIGDCLSSIGTGAETVVVDDGSTDGTGAVVARDFPSVRLLRQENAGVSAARNAGIRQATGDYLVFADADDMLCEGAVERLLAILETASPDIVVMRSFGSASEKYPWSGLFADGTVCSKDEIVRKGWLRGSVCGCGFRKRYLDESGISFAEGIPLSEDLVFMSTCLSAGGSVLFKDIPFYQVCEHSGSASRRTDPDYMRRYSLALGAAKERIQDPALYVATCRSIILGMIHLAAPNGYSPSRLRNEARLDAVLPLPAIAGSRYFREIRLMNACFPLYFRLKQLRDLCRRP